MRPPRAYPCGLLIAVMAALTLASWHEGAGEDRLTVPASRPSSGPEWKKSVAIEPQAQPPPPWLGVWKWTGESNFVMLLDPKRQIQYGPLFAGTYRMIDDETIELTLQGVRGERPDPISFHVEFRQGGQLMVWSQEGGRLVFRRVPAVPSPAPAGSRASPTEGAPGGSRR